MVMEVIVSLSRQRRRPERLLADKNQAAAIAQQFKIQPSPDPVQTVAPSSVTNADFGVNEDSGKRRPSK